MITITSSSNPTIKLIKSLYKKKDRWNKRLFVVEGIKIVDECLNSGYPIQYIVYSEQLFNVVGGRELFDRISSLPNLIKVPDKLFNEISDVETPQGILAIIPFEVKMMEGIDDDKEPFILLLDRVQDPGNLGTIIRTADAFGIDGIIVTEGCVDVYNPKVVRATMGSIFRVPIYHHERGEDIIRRLKEKGATVYSTSLQGKEFIQNADFKHFSLLIIGNESKGVSSNLESLADRLIKIPMVGKAESLNAAVASSIIMYEVLRQRINKFL